MYPRLRPIGYPTQPRAENVCGKCADYGQNRWPYLGMTLITQHLVYDERATPTAFTTHFSFEILPRLRLAGSFDFDKLTNTIR